MSTDRVTEIRARNVSNALHNVIRDREELRIELAQARRKIESVKRVHRRVPGYMLADECACEDHADADLFEDAWSGEMLCTASPTGDYYCAECTLTRDDEPGPWPCTTITAMTEEETK